jgi:hypothetical protein
MNVPMWFSNLVFWSAQVALLVLAAGFLSRLFQIRQPRVLLVYWRAILGISLMLPVVEPWHRMHSNGSIALTQGPDSLSTIQASNPAVTHWHYPGLQIIADVLGIAILAGIAVRFVSLALGLLKLRQIRAGLVADLSICRIRRRSRRNARSVEGPRRVSPFHPGRFARHFRSRGACDSLARAVPGD